jgi:hypothetical protein
MAGEDIRSWLANPISYFETQRSLSLSMAAFGTVAHAATLSRNQTLNIGLLRSKKIGKEAWKSIVNCGDLDGQSYVFGSILSKDRNIL